MSADRDSLGESRDFWQPRHDADSRVLPRATNTMTAGKFDHHWTVNGWKRIPHRLTTVKKIAMPPRRKTRKRRGAGATIDEALTFYQARKLAAAKVAADAFLASVSKDTSRRRLRHYDDLHNVQPMTGTAAREGKASGYFP